MKFKKAFAWILAVAMVITLMPSMAFASTTNSVDSVPTVSSDSKMPQDTILTLRVDDLVAWSASDWQKIKLTLENATWSDNPNNSSYNSTTSSGAITFNGTPSINISASGPAGSQAKIADVGFIAASDNSLEFQFKANAEKDDFIKLTIPKNIIKSGSDEGPVNIAIDGLDSKVTSKTITVANVGTSNTIASIAGNIKTFPRSTVTAGAIGTSIEIRETSVNSLLNGTQHSIKLSAPKGVTFSNSKADWQFSGDLINNKTANITNFAVDTDGRTATFIVNVEASDTVRNVLIIKPAITISRDATEGDIAIQLVGGTDSSLTGDDDNKISDASDLVIAKYGNESVEVSTIENIPTFVSGYLEDTKSKNFTFQVTLKENMVKSLAAGRYVDFELPDAVQIKGAIKAKIGSGSLQPVNNAFIEVGDINGNGAPNKTKDTSSFAFMVPEANNLAVASGNNWNLKKANTITFEVPVTVRADFSGDITCKVSGAKAGVEETELVVAKAESPIKVETKTTEVRNGVQTQAVADITITENYVGYLDDDTKVARNNELILGIDTLGLSNDTGMVFENYDSITVTEGDLELGKCTKSAGQLIIPIKNSSTKASTIEIKGAVVALNRTLPEGPYALQVYGRALIKNFDYNNEDFADPAYKNGDVCAAKVADYVKIVTPADPSTITNKINAVFTLRQDTFTNNGETVQMDTAPYLDANNRTQLPIRYAAIACGVPESDISWNQATQTATINGQNVVLRITIGSNIMQTSAGNVTMDTAAVSSNGRIFVPIRYIANALGADVAWDQDAKTITLTN